MKAQYTRYLDLIGVGYKATTEHIKCIPLYKTQNEVFTVANQLRLKLGFSHDVVFQVPKSVRVFCLKPTVVCCVGTNNSILTQFTAQIRAVKPPEVYKGKGIRYRNEVVIQKRSGKKK
jgi:large subunit ribosomal protein L6